jgi:PadR family transcriptional regulator PadR
MSRPPDMLQGMLDLLILRVLQREPLHGWAIGQRIRQLSDEVLQVQQGSLYPALHKLEEQGWIDATWGESENRRRAKFYQLTSAGRARLAEETAHWERLSSAIALVVRTA